MLSPMFVGTPVHEIALRSLEIKIMFYQWLKLVQRFC
jgi:hypothetical protein